MDIQTTVEDNKATLALSGKLTVQTSPELSASIEGLPEEITDIDIDCTDVDYVASAGLRVLVATDKLTSKRGGTMRILHPQADVVEVLEMTGLDAVFTIEKD